MSRIPFLCPAVAGVLLASVALGAESGFRVVVPASELERSAQVLTVELPAAIPNATHLVDDAGRAYSLQFLADGRAQFVVPHQPAGKPLALHVHSGGQGDKAGKVAVSRDEDGLALSIDGLPVIGYRTRPDVPAGVDPVFRRAGFIHPVLTPGGTLVTEAFPPDHLHQNGIWTAWTSTSFRGHELDFWNLAKKQGRVEFDQIEETHEGPVAGGFTSRHRAVDIRGAEPVTVLDEQWRVEVYAIGDSGARVFDLHIVQTNVTTDPLELKTYHYGGLGYRGHAQWHGKEKAHFLSSDGETDRVKAQGTRMRWCHMGGLVDGHFAGTAILGHPDNFRAPEPTRVNPNEPFFCFTPAPLGPANLEPGVPHTLRYRFVVADGRPDRAKIDSFWNGFAHPAQARVERAD